MRPTLRSLLLTAGLVAGAALSAQAPAPLEALEHRLPNGAWALLVVRPGSGAFHATLAFRGGRADEPEGLVGATDLLAQSLFGHTYPEDLEAPSAKHPLPLDALLEAEEKAAAALRQEGASAARRAEVARLQAELRTALRHGPLGDLYEARGALRQEAVAGQDCLRAGVELPKEAFAAWCETEAKRLAALRMPRFPLEREALLAELRSPARDRGLPLLLGAALPGHPYGRDLADHAAGLGALSLAQLRAHAREACAPGRMAVLLVGDLDPEETWRLLDRGLGALKGPAPAPTPTFDPALPEPSRGLGERQVQAATEGAPRMLLGWRSRAEERTDQMALRLLGDLLGRGPSSRLVQALLVRKGLARSLDVASGVPGQRSASLLTVEARPAEGHNLQELEDAIQGEVLRLHRDPVPLDEWQKALNQEDLDFLLAQEDPARLCDLLAEAWAARRDWRAPFEERAKLHDLGPAVLEAAARRLLVPANRTAVFLEPDAGSSKDPVEAELASILRALVQKKIPDPAQAEAAVSESLRQLRMLPREDRERTLALLREQLQRVEP